MVVVFATPPFWFASTMTRVAALEAASGGGTGWSPGTSGVSCSRIEWLDVDRAGEERRGIESRRWVAHRRIVGREG